jgi:hypothetical protein
VGFFPTYQRRTSFATEEETMRQSCLPLGLANEAAAGAPFGRQHLEGLRRGVLFMLAIATAVFLFASVGWQGGDVSAQTLVRRSIPLCSVDAPSCVGASPRFEVSSRAP